MSALILVVCAAAVSLVGCSGPSTVDGAYVTVEDGFLRSGWVVEGDQMTHLSGACEDNVGTTYTLSNDRSRRTSTDDGEIDSVSWYEDKSGFVTNDFNFVRADSEAAKPLIEQWESEWGRDWEH